MWEDLLLFVAVGFAAQMVDGAIGMAYGVISSSVMLSLGVPPATTSACVHAAETFTTAVSGASHWKLGNVDRKLLLRLALPGAIGGAIGFCVAFASLKTLDAAIQLSAISLLDAAAFAGGIAAVIAVAALAVYYPARRATRIDPAVALRAD